ncbi:MAG: flagellar M-ring protein FliF [Candidatus Zixiibacteriota bacterium]|nr:MAG: flagellar M-ring protein FliF [candidate division Zixibacteria bacterium]
MEYLKRLFKNISEFVRAMTPSQAIMLIGVVAGLIVGAVVVSSWISDASYSTLYSNLDPTEAGEIADYLTEQNTPFKLSDGGRTISVPSGDVYKVRISLASQGMPQSGNIGYGILDQSNLGMTEFLQNLNFRRALEGELMRTIMQLSSVQAARVHIVMPKDRLFKKQQQEATASVVLKLRRPNGLSKSQLSGITHLVASSVEGLKPENISIIDYDGNLLSSEMASDMLAGLSASQLEVRKNVEQYLEDKAQTMLDGVVGQGKSIVRVTADLNFKQVESTSEQYDPNSTVIRSEEKTEESGSSSDKQDELAESNDEKRVETSITNYEINKSVEHMIGSVGNVHRLSVAVLLDGVYREVENAEGVMEVVYEPRPQEDIDRITALVRNAVGFDSERSDQIEVVNLAFDRTSMEFEQGKLDKIYQQEFLFNIAKKIGTVLLVVLAFLYLRKRARKLFASLAKILPPGRLAAPGRPPAYAGQESEEEPIPTVEPDKRRPKLVDQMQKTAKQEPEEIAKVIKTMMVE